ncbi:alanine--tRNA ligase [Candidatus Marinamargulisbacteria bacterium SCGC AG-410-N11]|nr:alanine--tRNA ligase [Candidatus Marinamargulisbacteria bacterium SCGC AG-410-N11]
MISGKEVRDQFIKFFKQKQHQFVPASPIVPTDDPTLLFTNAGMNQFKDVFLGTGSRDYKRAVNSQVCIRVSGKHNDLEDVGFDTTHLTSFEMLGNWSFGDYYKKEAIIWSWELLTKIYKIPKDKLYATVYEEDNEAFELWKTETDINPNHIVKCGKKDNFWEMGETGPCGPCSEIHVDIGNTQSNIIERDPNTGGLSERYIELWNLVFIQYNRQEDKTLIPLPQTHIDTGAGLERLVAYLQGSTSNYDTDLIKPLIQKIESLSNVPYQSNEKGMPHRVIADHIRTISFGIADNIMPSNDGRGYVLRRLLRRAVRYSTKLNINEPILYKLVNDVVNTLGSHFNHLKDRQKYIETIIKAEEIQFLKTIESGIQHFENLITQLSKNNTKTIPGTESFKLYDTYGFPIDLTQVMAKEKGFTINMTTFQEELNKQKERSRKSTKEKLKQVQKQENITKINQDLFKDLNLHLSEYTDKARGGEARLISDPTEKIAMAQHHTATHLLHEALRNILGNHIQQAGSLVDTNRLRFDFTHYEAISETDLSTIEKTVNDQIIKNHKVTIEKMTLQEAKKKGAMALFGEKYQEDNVRVVNINNYSIELCGGTHVYNTSMIEKFKIISESAIAAGTRRIEAISGNTVINNHNNQIKQTLIDSIHNKLKKIESEIQFLTKLNIDLPKFKINNLTKLNIKELKEKDQESQHYIKQIKKQYEKNQDQFAAQVVNETINKSEKLNKSNWQLYYENFNNQDSKFLQNIADKIINKNKKLIAILSSNINEKGFLLVKIGPEINTKIISAKDIVNQVTTITGGGGGGKESLAKAGGINATKISSAITSIKEIIKEKCSNE